MRRSFVSLLVGLLSFSNVPAEIASAAESPVRRIVFVVADDLNTEIGCYGSTRVRTPHLDRLAERGVRFDFAYCNVPLCNPSRTSFLSGRRTRGKKVPAKDWMPNLFSAHDFRTVEAGKVSHGYGASRNIPSWNTDVRGIDEAVEMLGAPHDEPLFLAVGLDSTHAGTHYDREFKKLYPPEKLAIPEEPADVLVDVPEAALNKVNRADRTPEERREHVSEYYARISTVDAEVGRLMKVLDERKLWDETVFVFFSDHGRHIGDHGGIYDKRSLFERSVRVPLIIAAPGVKPGVSERTVELVDVYPTLLDLCGFSHPAGLEGDSLAPLLAKPDAEWSHPAITFSPMVRGGVTMRTEEYRFTRWGEKGPYELYDHRTDPREFVNLAAKSEQATILERLEARLEDALRPTATGKSSR